MPEAEIVKALDRISKILAGLLLQDIEEAEQSRKIKRLKSCGFSNTEIADMLNTTVNTVNVAVHSLKHRKRRKTQTGRKRKSLP
jgi:DNA-binding NarL/FixJ family response regulator